jgi:NAD(P)H-flavin reductase
VPRTALLSNEPDARDLRRILLDRAPEGHTRPGQYVVVTVDGAARPGFFALASDPGAPAVLLVKQQGETAERLTALRAGDTVEMSEARGAGFPLERGADLPLVMLVNGSGISAARPVVRAEIGRGLPRAVHVFYGVLDAERVGFADELGGWRAAGVGVTVVMDPSGAAGWAGAVGYVQEHARAAGLLDGRAAVVLVGVPAMIQDVRDQWAASGHDADLLLTNF